MSIKVTEDGKYVLKVDGEEITLTADELEAKIAEVQKGEAASKRLQTATETQKAAEKALREADARAQERLANLFKLADTGDEDAYEKILDLQGFEDDEKESRLEAYRQLIERRRNPEGAAKTGKEAKVASSTSDTSSKKITLEDLDPKLAKALEALTGERAAKALGYAWDQRNEAGRRELRADLSEAIRKNASLKGYLESEGADKHPLLNMAEKLVQVAVHNGEQYDDALLQRVVEEANSFVKAVNVGGEPDITGLGIAPTLGHSETHAATPPKSVPLSDSKYIANVTEQLAHLVRGGEIPTAT